MAGSLLRRVRLICAARLVGKDRQFPLQLWTGVASLEAVRGLTIFCLLVRCASRSWAQNQEPSLVDRLLRPNMDLKNNAQNKKFAVNSTAPTKGGTVGTFYLQPTRSEKPFQESRIITATKHSSSEFRYGKENAALLQKGTANASIHFPTSQARDVRDVHDAGKIVSGRAYPEDRSFREEGKSQKSLARHNRPLTIDEVRELLNKNK